MVFQINGKTLLECKENDIQLLIDDPAFRESEYIDYKENFAFLEIEDKTAKNGKKVEFRNDVCSFANAEGGYLVYGIKEKQGTVSEIIGITIPKNDTDKFELQRRNDLQPIFPRVPNIKFSFIPLQSGKHVVVMYIKHDSVAPYTQIENQVNYKFFKRAGNEKVTMTYAEIRNMFNDSIALDKEIEKYRKERLHFYGEQSEEHNDYYSKFLLLHVIPDTFLDSDYDHSVFSIEKKKGQIFSHIFSEFGCNLPSIPCVDGLKFYPYSFTNTPSICYIYNNGIMECFQSLKDVSFAGDDFFPSEYIWEKIDTALDKYIEVFKENKLAEQVYVCISIYGCKGMISEPANYDTLYKGVIDRKIIKCTPILIDNIFNDDTIVMCKKRIYVDYLLSISIKHNPILENYIKELY